MFNALQIGAKRWAWAGMALPNETQFVKEGPNPRTVDFHGIPFSVRVSIILG
jgi:hypothetical protein